MFYLIWEVKAISKASEVETIRKNWKGDASDKYIGKLESVYNDISNTCTALENLGVGMSREASNIYQNQ